MRSVQLRRRLLGALVCLGLVLAGQNVALGDELFRAVPDERGDRELAGVQGVERFRFVTVDLAQVGSGFGQGYFKPETRLTLNLFPDVTVRAELERAGVSGSTDQHWVGRLVEPAVGKVILAFSEDTLSGTVTVGGVVYQIRNDGDPVHAIRELSPAESAELSPLISASGGNPSPEMKVFRLVNHERRMRGLHLYEWNDALAEAAREHSRDMGRRDFFNHVNPDGLDAGDRMRKAGYEWSDWSENIAAGQETPVQVVEAWMNSTSHRLSILCGVDGTDGIDLYDIGVGYVEVPDSRYGHYWTQKFGSER
ncbi:MAG: CAP domain-containing protein [Candidatus Bipolaricaulota bacterium]